MQGQGRGRRERKQSIGSRCESGVAVVVVPVRGGCELVENIVHKCEHVEVYLTRMTRYRQSMHILRLGIAMLSSPSSAMALYACGRGREQDASDIVERSRSQKQRNATSAPWHVPTYQVYPRYAAFMTIHSSR